MKRSKILAGTLALVVALLLLYRFFKPIATPPYENENVILITVDALRPDHLGCYGYPKPTSPKLDQWAEQGVIFKNTISASSWTMPSLVSLMTGLTPAAHGVEIRGNYLLPVIPPLPKIVQQYGYITPNLTYLTSEPSFMNLGYPPPSENLVALLNQNLVEKYINRHPRQKFFIWYHYRFVHLPYNPKPEYEKLFLDESKLSPKQRKRVDAVKREVLLSPKVERFLPEDAAPIRALYDADIRQFDDFFGDILAALKANNLEKNTIVILSSDHGEELFDHGWIGHSSSGYRATLYDELIKIPLIIVAPGLLPKHVIFQPQVRSIDLVPILLDLLKIPPVRNLQGQSLLPYVRDQKKFKEEPAFSETSIQGYRTQPEDELFRIMSLRDSRWKIVKHFDRRGTYFELYNLERDPGEKDDLAIRMPKRTKQLAEQMSAIFLRSLQIQSNYHALEDKEEEKNARSSIHYNAPVILSPRADDHIGYGASQGYVTIQWKGEPDLTYEVQYRIGKGIYRMKGSVFIAGNTHRFGPFPEKNWDLFRLWNPWNFRVRVQGGRSPWSNWNTFSVDKK